MSAQAIPPSFSWMLSPWMNFTSLTISPANSMFAYKSVNIALPSYCGEGVHTIDQIRTQ